MTGSAPRYAVATTNRDVTLHWPGLPDRPFLHTGFRVARSAIFRVTATDPWPSARLELWPANGEREVFELARAPLESPWLMTRRDNFALQEQVIETLFEWIERRAPHVIVERGWLAHPAVVAEPVDVWPQPAARGGYREQAREGSYLARSPPTPFEALKAWLGSSPDKPWRETARRVAATPDHLYAELWSGRSVRMPVRALREGHDVGGGDWVFVFGRRTRLVLSTRHGCSVMDLLHEQLARAATRARDEWDATKLDLNRATFHDLVALPHIGRARAKAILQLRKRRSGFVSVREVMGLRGFGPKHFAAIAAKVTVGPRPAE